MTHRFPIKEIARQAALGTATVDRVLNNRAHVSAQTRNRVRAAIAELEQQEGQLAARGRRMFIDIVVEAPARFSDQIARAAKAAIEGFTAGVFRPRFVFHERFETDAVVDLLTRIAQRGSHGVCLKARDVPAISRAVDRLQAQGIPVVTLVTDIPGSQRTAYVGVDNKSAGRTAAYLIARSLRGDVGCVFATRSLDAFYGEAERLLAFRATLGELAPGLSIVDIAGGGGLRQATARLFDEAVARHGPPVAVYSMGGGNAAILDAMPKVTSRGLVFVAHDLDSENATLLRDGRLSFVLEHSLRTDIRNVLTAIAGVHGLVRAPGAVLTSDLQVVTPYNISV